MPRPAPASSTRTAAMNGSVAPSGTHDAPEKVTWPQVNPRSAAVVISTTDVAGASSMTAQAMRDSPARAPTMARPLLVSGPTSEARPVSRPSASTGISSVESAIAPTVSPRTSALKRSSGPSPSTTPECSAKAMAAAEDSYASSSTASAAESRSARGSIRPTRAAPITTSAAVAPSCRSLPRASARVLNDCWTSERLNSMVPVSSLLDPEEPDAHVARIAFANPDEDRAREPLQIGTGRLERRHRPEVDQCRIHRLASQQPLHHIRRGVADALVLHVDDLPLVGLERVARIELREAIRLDDLPVGAAGEHLPLDRRPLERAAEDLHDPPATVRHLADLGGGRDRNARLERERQPRR